MNNFLTQLKTNWVLIIFIGTMVVSWTTFSLRLTAVELKAGGNSDSALISAQQVVTLNTNVFLICNELSLNCIRP